MSDQMSGGGDPVQSLGMGLMNYLDAAAANKAARAQNATIDKWGPLLALNKSKGSAEVKVPNASFAKIMGPAFFSAMNPMSQSGGGGGAGGGGGGGGGGSESLGVDTSMPSLGALSDYGLAGGGKIGGSAWHKMAQQAAAGAPKYAGGGLLDPLGLMSGGGGGGGQQGGGKSGLSSLMSLLPMIAMMADKGGMVPGQPAVEGDSPENDKVLTVTSPGEAVVPRSVMHNPKPRKVAQFLSEVKKHGPGPMPVKGSAMGGMPQPGKPQGPSMGKSVSPWTAMACGGMVGKGGR